MRTVYAWSAAGAWTPRGSDRCAGRLTGVSSPTVPRSWTRLRDWDQLQRQSQKGGLIVILDSATESHYHHPACEHVAKHHFETKRSYRWEHGSYCWIANGGDAVGFATACAVCEGRPPHPV